jgi:flagellar basal-body rod protein FlgB
VDPVTQVLIGKALDGLSLRAIATAQNVANANSPGFRASRVSFEDTLREAAKGGADGIRNVTPKVETEAHSGEMRLDLELATASETAMRYAALVDLLSRQLQISRTVIRGGQ